MIEIETERLTLKQLGIADKEQLIDLIGDFRVSKTVSNVPHPYTDEDAEYWLNSVNTSEFKLNIFRNSVLIGGIGLTPEDDDYCELGYWLGFEYWGKGYATEACNSLLNYAKTNTSYKHFKFMKIVMSSNSSFYVYNFMRHLIIDFLSKGFSIDIIAPKDEYSVLLEKLGCKYHHIFLKPRSKNVIDDIILIFS